MYDHFMPRAWLFTLTMQESNNKKLLDIVKKFIKVIDYKINVPALAGVAQWIECQTGSQRIAGFTPRQGTCLGCRPGPQ